MKFSENRYDKYIKKIATKITPKENTVLFLNVEEDIVNVVSKHIPKSEFIIAQIQVNKNKKISKKDLKKISEYKYVIVDDSMETLNKFDLSDIKTNFYLIDTQSTKIEEENVELLKKNLVTIYTYVDERKQHLVDIFGFNNIKLLGNIYEDVNNQLISEKKDLKNYINNFIDKKIVYVSLETSNNIMKETYESIAKELTNYHIFFNQLTMTKVADCEIKYFNDEHKKIFLLNSDIIVTNVDEDKKIANIMGKSSIHIDEIENIDLAKLKVEMKVLSDEEDSRFKSIIANTCARNIVIDIMNPQIYSNLVKNK